jgi:hypothetical protein
MDEIRFRIAQIDDVDNVYQFECQKNFQDQAEQIENQMLIWNSAYRKEALIHYFKLGWSFIACNNENQILGFFLGQPLLFVDHQTQSLWIEYVSATTSEIKNELVEIAYKLSREKHFQRVLISADLEMTTSNKKFPFVNWQRTTSVLKTTK